MGSTTAERSEAARRDGGRGGGGGAGGRRGGGSGVEDGHVMQSTCGFFERFGRQPRPPKDGHAGVNLGTTRMAPPAGGGAAGRCQPGDGEAAD